MSQKNDFPDEPLPDDPPPTEEEGNVVFEQSQSTHASSEITAFNGGPEHLPAADRETLSAYGRVDPASLAALQSTELAEPDLHNQEQAELANAQVVSQSVATAPDTQETAKLTLLELDLSNWDPHLAHLAQVGLTSADHWEVQVKPRIDQLHDDINMVNMRLDNLVRFKSKYKHS